MRNEKLKIKNEGYVEGTKRMMFTDQIKKNVGKTYRDMKRKAERGEN